MRMTFLGVGLIATVLCSISYAHGQQTTERFIPMGQSPGLSGKYTYLGEIAAVDSRRQIIKVGEQRGTRTIKVTKDTRIWLDRSKLKKTNLTGSFADLQKGRRVEVKFVDPQRRQKAEWIKVEVGQS